MTDNNQNSGNLADDMAEYLPTFLDETEEQLDDLVETMLALERDASNKDDLNEAFRLIHSIKGSAGMMGFDNITVLTHHLENHFERLRSGLARLDEPAMNLVLRCIDFLRQCNKRLRDGEQLGTSAELLDELRRLEQRAIATETDQPEEEAGEPHKLDAKVTPSPSSASPDEQDVGDAPLHMIVRFRAGLQLVDLKAQLIATRLSRLGDVKSTRPDLAQLADVEQIEEFEIQIDTQEDFDSLRAAADVDGVESIDFAGTPSAASPGGSVEEPPPRDDVIDAPTTQESETTAVSEPPAAETETTATDEPDLSDRFEKAPSLVAPATGDGPGNDSGPIGGAGASPGPRSRDDRSTIAGRESPAEPAVAPTGPVTASDSSTAEKTPTKVTETMRVAIGRLDNLMNLTGELVVNRARFAQISEQISPALRRTTMLNRIRDFGDGLRRTIERLENDPGGDWSAQIQQLRSGLELLDEQSEIWDNSRHCYSQINEAIDQLSRVSHGLQIGVLDTRMVPVGPLFNRFKRVVRDLSMERGKKVDLLIRGEKTELDKRMIDELGDPLVHLVRNSIDHGLEPPDVRVRHGKPEAGTISLEASHSGNNVYIIVRDDGGGIDVDKIKAKLIGSQVLSEAAVAELSDEQALDTIWHPGFSTAQEVTDVSGRGVGMDVVKTRVHQLNGTIEVDSTPQQGTTFTIRLPLTLAIINCLLVRLRKVVFSMPIDDVREIVSVNEGDVVTVQGTHTFDVRGEFIPLVSIDSVFQWHGIDYGCCRPEDIRDADAPSETVDVVILRAGGRAMGLRVDELLGSQDVVIKSLSDNFINIRGLSGSSILGDGSVCLMLDVGTLIDMATKPSRRAETKELTT